MKNRQETERESHIMREITPLSERDCFYIVDRHKSAFDYPIHCHRECELNFIEHAAGAHRIVGDSEEVIGEYDLVFIAGSELEHAWEQGECQSRDIHEITIQFNIGDWPDSMWQKNQFGSMRRMMERAQCGLAFPLSVIMKVYSKLENLSEHREGFHAVLDLLDILHELSLHDSARQLSSSAFARIEMQSDSRRVDKVQKYIAHHYNDDIRLEDMAQMVDMTPVAFSRFFRQRSGRTLSDYIIDIRIGSAARMLIDTTNTVAEICYDCGFNTLSNFNRLFRRKKGCSPKEFRENYQKKKIFI